jgi:hypothetical protein
MSEQVPGAANVPIASTTHKTFDIGMMSSQKCQYCMSVYDRRS